MKIAARAPVRIDPAGGGTDAPPYCSDHGGCVVNMSVARHSYAQLQWLPQGDGVHIYSHDLKRGERAASVDELTPDGELKFIKGFIRRLLKDRSDFLLVTRSDIPVRTGLGGSGAMGVALTMACLKAMGQPIDQCDVALVANEIERHDLKFAGGSQDSFGAAVGGAKKIVYHKGGGCACTRLNLPPEMAQRLQSDMLLIHTGKVHLSGTIHEDIKRAYEMDNSPVVAAMDRLKAAANTMAGALEAGDMNGFVAALNDSRKGHYALHESCDSDVLRSFFTKLDPFIIGGKTCGAGGGGFIVVVTRPGCKEACIDAARTLSEMVWPFAMDDDGTVVSEELEWTADEVAELRSLATS